MEHTVRMETRFAKKEGRLLILEYLAHHFEKDPNDQFDIE